MSCACVALRVCVAYGVRVRVCVCACVRVCEYCGECKYVYNNICKNIRLLAQSPQYSTSSRPLPSSLPLRALQLEPASCSLLSSFPLTLSFKAQESIMIGYSDGNLASCKQSSSSPLLPVLADLFCLLSFFFSPF
jgi:hypothetical protein